MTTVPTPSPRVLPSADELVHNMRVVRGRIAAAAARAGREADAVTLVAVSKTVPLDYLRSVEAVAGFTDLGENRGQEAEPKVDALGRAGRPIVWHLIGHLQRNKAMPAVGLFDLIHSVDSRDLAATIDRYAESAGKRQRVLFQVNVAGEESKSGFAPDALRAVAPELAALGRLCPEGLMTIAPLGANERELRAIFRSLRALRDELAPAFSNSAGAWRHLSMGMTDDYEVAVEEGATIVRVGRAIFGQRPALPAL